MEVRINLPQAIVETLVKHYEIIKNDGAEPLVDKHIPNGYASLVFNFINGVSVVGHSLLPPCIIVTPFLQAINIQANEGIDTFVVICKASVLSRLLDFDLYPRQFDSYIPLDDNFFIELWEKLNDASKPEERISVFENYFLERTPIGYYKTDEIDSIYDNILHDIGKTPINKLMAICNIKPRTFRRNFIQRVGINAKTLSRLVRVNYLWEKIMNQNAIDFQELVFDCDYYDQSHFINDFKMITGESPSHFFKRNLDLVKIISGKN